MAQQRILGVVLAGGAGRRLGPLTADRAKSAVPFGGIYRVVDFTLSNVVNGGIERVCVLTQYKSHSLNRHITTTWRLSSLLDNYVTPVPAQQWRGPRWQAGSADAIYQSLTLIERDRPDLVLVAGADHVHRMDPNQMIQAHLDWDAGVTVAAIPVPRPAASDFGVIRAGAGGHRIEAFQEKPADPPSLHGSPDEAFASMGTYVFDTGVLVEALSKDAADEDSRHSIGGDIIPRLVRDGAAHVYDFMQNKVPGADARPGLLARGRHRRLLLRGAHGSVRCPPGVQSLQRPVADPDPRASGPAGQVRARGRGPGGTGVQQRDQQRGDRLRRADPRIGNLPRGPGGQLGQGGAVGNPAQLAGRAARGGGARHPGQKRHGAGGCRDRGGQGARPSPRIPGVRRRHYRGRQGTGGRT